MRASLPFLRGDLSALEELYERAEAVVPMETIFDGECRPNVIAVRHDCDNVIHPAVDLAKWEAERGYRSTYYILHSSPYWQDKALLQSSLETIAEHGHCIGIHCDAITVALQTGRDPIEVIREAVDELRSYGHEIRSTVAHGHHLCHVARYVNDEIWETCHRPDYGDRERVLKYNGRAVQLRHVSLNTLDLDFDANWIRRGDYLSDSGGHWSQPFDDVASAFPSRGQLHLLQHPDWWSGAFEKREVAA